MKNTLRRLAFLALLAVYMAVPSCATTSPIVNRTLSCVGVNFTTVLPDVENDLLAGDFAALEVLAGRFTFDVIACAVQAATTKAKATRGEADPVVTNGREWLASHHTVVK